MIPGMSNSQLPEVAMICGISLLVSGLASAVVLLRIAERLDPSYWPVAVAGLMLLSTFVLTQFAGNQFGFDRDGLRALLLAPVPRARLLLAKNLATGAVASAPCAVVLAVAAVGLRLPAAALLAALFQAAALVLLFIGAGNVVSILVPYRIASGTLKATNLPPGAMIAVALCQILFPTLLSPVLLGPLAQAALHASGSSWAMRVNLPASLAVALGAAALYRVSLAPLGRWLQRRETVILARVSTETE